MKFQEAGAEAQLAERFATTRPTSLQAIEAREYERAMTMIAQDLREPIDRFFEQVFVMVDREDIRTNRLRLLGSIARILVRIAHFQLLAGASK